MACSHFAVLGSIGLWETNALVQAKFVPTTIRAILTFSVYRWHQAAGTPLEVCSINTLPFTITYGQSTYFDKDQQNNTSQ